KEDWRKAVKKDLYPPRVFLKHIPDRVTRIVNKAIHKEKNKRFQNCLEFRQALERLIFNIDWSVVDNDNWIGTSTKDDVFKITRRKSKTGYVVEWKKNDRRDKSLGASGLTEADSELLMINLVRSSTLS